MLDNNSDKKVFSDGYPFFMKTVSAVFLCLILPLIAEAKMAVFYKEVAVASGEPSVIMKYFKDDRDRPLILSKKDNKIVGSIDPVSELLARYYTLMINQRIDDVTELYYRADGSQARYLQGLVEIPNRYEGYQSLSQINLLGRYGWGPFEIVSLRLSGGGSTLVWREAVICKAKKCWLSNAIDASDANFNTYGAHARGAKSQFSQGQLQQQFESFNSVTWLPAGASDYVGFNQYPVQISSRVGKSDYLIQLGFNKDPAAYNGKNIKPVVNFLSELRRLGTEINTSDDVDEEKIASQMEPLLGQYVMTPADQTGFEFNLSSRFTNNPSVKVEWYHPIAAMQRIGHWDQIRIAGWVELDDRVALYYQPTRIEEELRIVEPVQLLILKQSESGDWRPTLEGPRSRYAYLFDDSVMDSVQRQLGAEVTFIYSANES